MNQKKIKSQPLLRGLIHQAMFFIAIGACAPLIIKSSSAVGYVATSIYSAAVLMMFGFSALYHRFNWYNTTEKWIRKLDHAGVFIMIAGTITPLSLLVLPRGKDTFDSDLEYSYLWNSPIIFIFTTSKDDKSFNICVDGMYSNTLFSFNFSNN